VRKSLLGMGLVLSPCVFASSSIVNVGPNLTTGPSSNHHSIFAGAGNPSTSAFMVDKDENWRFNFAPAFAVSAELGEVDNFTDELDELIELIDDEVVSDDPVEETLARFNNVLVEIGESGYLKSSVAVRAPIAPLYYRSDSLGGTFYADYQMNSQVGVRLLDAPLQYNVQTNYSTSSSVYLKSGIENRISVGFAKEFDQFDSIRKFADLYAGVRLNVITLDLSKQVTPLQVLDGESVQDYMEDEYDTNLVSSTGASIDVGVTLARENMRLGLTIANIGEPSFDYGVVGENCEDREPGSNEQTTCEVTRFFAEARGEINTREAHTMNMISRIDGAWRLREGLWINGSWDLAAYDDFVGFENQWLHTGLSYDFEKFVMPSFRVGYQVNQADAGTSSALFGLTLIKWINLDFEYGLDSAVVDGDKYPRRVGFSLSIFERF